MSDNLISFSDMFKDEIKKFETEIPKLNTSELVPPAKASRDEALEVNCYYKVFLLIRDSMNEFSHDFMCDLLINHIHLPVTPEEVTEYIKVVRETPLEDEWVLLFFTVCAVWRRTLENMSINISFRHLQNAQSLDKAFARNGRAGVNQIEYAKYLAIVVANTYVILSKELQALLPELVDPKHSNISKDYMALMTPFALISLALMTMEFCKARVVDCNRVNEWCESTHLNEQSTYNEILNTSKEFFGGRTEL